MNATVASAGATILIVDDVPENLAVAHDALDTAGYTVRVATSGIAALESARRQPPDLILLDAVMPGLDGFDTCRRLKADLSTRQIPVVFMTGLTDSEHVVLGFQAGGIDYVTKPIRPQEVIARIASHLRSARLVADTQAAADAAGDAIVAIDETGRLSWATPLAQTWLAPLSDAQHRLPASLLRWLDCGDAGSPTFSLLADGQRLSFARLGPRRLLVQRIETVPEPETLARLLNITAREADVLYWIVLGKTNPEIASVLEMSPRTVNKHLEHIFTKLGVETRTAAATVALNRSRLGVVAG